MSLDHRFTRSSPSLIPLLDDSEPTLPEIMKMHEAPFLTVHLDVNDDSQDTRARAEFLNREGDGDESEEYSEDGANKNFNDG